jgi:hypothetical protein
VLAVNNTYVRNGSRWLLQRMLPARLINFGAQINSEDSAFAALPS